MVIIVGCVTWSDGGGGSSAIGGVVALVLADVENDTDGGSSDSIGEDESVMNVVGTKGDDVKVGVITGPVVSVVRPVSTEVSVGDKLSLPPSPSPMVTVMVSLGSSVTMFVLT